MYKVAIIGTGKIAGLYDIPGKGKEIYSHARAIDLNPKLSLECVVNPDKKDSKLFCTKWKPNNVYADLEIFLRNNNCDIISVCSPDNTHFDITTKILKSSSSPKILFIEKPICLSLKELNTLNRLVKKSRTLIIVNHKRRFDQSHQNLKKLISSGELGKLLSGSFTYYGGWLHNGVHLLDLLIYLFGTNFTAGNTQINKFGAPGDRCLDTTLYFDKSVIRVNSADEKYYQLFEGEVRFTKGRVLYRDFGNEIIVEKIQRNKLGENVLTPLSAKGIIGLGSTLQESYKLFCEYLGNKTVSKLEEVNLHNINTVMKKLFRIREEAMDLKNKSLAINGGIPVRSKPWIDNFTTGEEEKKAVLEVMESGYLSLFEGSHTPDPPFSFYGGPKVQEIENRWCDYYGVPYAVSMNSATSGLYASVGALGLGYGDEIIVSPYTMSACAVAPLIYGAIPIFADVRLETGSLDPKSIEKNITKRTKAIIVIHQFGVPADMDEIMLIAKKYNLKVIEDCAQAHGAKYKGRYVGTIGDIGVFSLNVNKTIQSGEGSLVVTNNEDLRYRLALIRNHGEAVVESAGYKNTINILGYNYRLTEIGAAIALEQFKKLETLNRIRLEFVEMLKEELIKYDFIKVVENLMSATGMNQKIFSTYYVFPFRYLSEHTNISRKDVVSALNAEGACFYQGYVKPLYFQPLYQNKCAFKYGYPFSAKENSEIVTNYDKGSCPNAEKLHFEQMVVNEHIRFPHTPGDMKDLITIIQKVLH